MKDGLGHNPATHQSWRTNCVRVITKAITDLLIPEFFFKVKLGLVHNMGRPSQLTDHNDETSSHPISVCF